MPKPEPPLVSFEDQTRVGALSADRAVVAIEQAALGLQEEERDECS